MLCKRTMRAALAPVIGLFGALVAMTGAAVQLGYVVEGIAPDQNPPARYAAETLSEVDCQLVGTRCAGYRIVATSTDMTITAISDILLPSDNAARYYVRYDFSGAIFARDLAADDLTVNDGGDAQEVAAAEVAYRGVKAQSTVIFQLDAGGFGKSTVFTLDLSGETVADDDQTAEVDESEPGYAHINVTRIGAITASISVHASLTGAVDGTTKIYSASGTIASIASIVSGKITANTDVADVSTSVEDGGPFRRFIPAPLGMGGKDSGVLATVVTKVNQKPNARWVKGYRDATTGYGVNENIVGSLSVEATTEAGNFAVATKDGGVIVASKTGEKTNRNPWMVASKADCGNGPLTLGVVGATIETFKSRDCPSGSAADCDADPDGKPDPATGGGGLKDSDLTPAGIASANIARGNAGQAVGTNYFCVLMTGNTDTIPEIGDPVAKNAYSLTVTPKLRNAKAAFPPSAIGPAAAGAIDRNGTTVHLPYLSTHDAYNQRLVLVNRGADEALFWIEDDSFNLETGTTLMMNNLSLENSMVIPGQGRLVIRVQDNITFNADGKTRGAGTVNVAAPTRDIDVMTIQVHPGTGQIDTTVYQYAE